MSSRNKRLKRLEAKTPVERVFIEWLGNPWTEEQKAEAIRRDPDCRVFCRSLLESCSAPAEGATDAAD